MAITLNAPSQVRPYATFSSFPATGSLKTIYIAEDTNKIYRWTGSAYVELSETDATTWGSITGTLSAQTDLQTALDAKFDEPTGNSTQYLDGTGAPTTFPTALPPSGTAGGDLTGTYPNPTVHRIHGIDLQNGTPSTGDVWVYGGSPAKWQHQHLNASQVDNDSSVTGTSVELALEHLDSTKVTTTRTLTINGTTQDLSADRTFTISTGITIGTTAITSGTVGRVLFEGTGNVVQESANLFWDNTNGRLGVNTSTPTSPFTLIGASQFGNAVGAGSIETFDGYYSYSFGKSTSIYNPNNNYTRIWMATSETKIDNFTGNFLFRSAARSIFGLADGVVNFYNQSNTVVSKFFSNTGNWGINTTTDAGFKVDINGTARISDNLLLTNGIIATSGATTRLQGSLNYFTHNRIASSGVLGFQISSYGTATSFWRYNDGTGDVEFGNVGAYGVQFFGNNTARAKMWSNGQWTIGSGTAYTASALMALEATDRGFLPPRMTTTQKNAIATPAAGLMVYDTTLNLMSVYNGTTWITL